MTWRAYLVFSDGEKMDLEETFHSKEEARAAAYQAGSDFDQGGVYLEEADEEGCDAELIGFILESDDETIEIEL